MHSHDTAGARFAVGRGLIQNASILQAKSKQHFPQPICYAGRNGWRAAPDFQTRPLPKPDILKFEVDWRTDQAVSSEEEAKEGMVQLTFDDRLGAASLLSDLFAHMALPETYVATVAEYDFTIWSEDGIEWVLQIWNSQTNKWIELYGVKPAIERLANVAVRFDTPQEAKAAGNAWAENIRISAAIWRKL